MTKLSHFDSLGKAQMIDISAKPDSFRLAIAEGLLKMQPATIDMLTSNDNVKGDAFTIAKIAGIQAGKQVAQLIPLCHGLALTFADLAFKPWPDNRQPAVGIRAWAGVCAKTGAEMEALTMVSVAALALFDMAKAVDKSMVIADVQLTYKSGGRSGTISAETLFPKWPLAIKNEPARPDR